MIQLNIKEGKNAIKVVERLLLWGEAYKEKHGNDPFDKCKFPLNPPGSPIESARSQKRTVCWHQKSNVLASRAGLAVLRRGPFSISGKFHQ